MLPSLNSRLLELGQGVSLADRAPNSWADLTTSGLNDLHVWPGASDKCIYGKPEVNHALRYWHDRIHLEYDLSFSLEDELIVAEIHLESLHDDSHKRIVYADIAEQVRYYYQHGEYVADQRNFIENLL